MVAERAHPGAVGHDGPQRRGVGGRLEQQLTADRQADPADPRAVDVGARREVAQGRRQVSLTVPPERVEVTLARPLPAAVEQQDAVAVANEHPRVGHRAGATREGDHRSAVARRHVPALQNQSIARSEAHLFVRASEISGRHRRPGLVRRKDRERRRKNDEDDAEEDGEGDGQAPQRAASGRVATRLRPPGAAGRVDPAADQHDARKPREDSGQVIAGESIDDHVPGRDADTAHQRKHS